MAFDPTNYEGQDRLAHIEKYVKAHDVALASPSTGQADPTALAAGYKGWTWFPYAATTGTSLTSQKIYAMGIALNAGAVINNVVLQVITSGVGTTPTGFFVGICNATTMLAQSGNLNANAGLTTQGQMAFPLSAAYTVPTSGLYFAVFLQNGAFGTTNVAFGRFSFNLSGAGVAIGTTGVDLMANIGTSQTALPANNATVTFAAENQSAFFAGLS